MLPALDPDFQLDWDRKSPLASRSEISIADFKELKVPRRPPPMNEQIRQAIQRFGGTDSLFDTQLDGWSVTSDANFDERSCQGTWMIDGWSPSHVSDNEVLSLTQNWHKHLTLKTEEQRLLARADELEALERRAHKHAAEAALRARRLQRREADVSAVEERAKRTMAELAKRNLEAKRQEFELAQREDMTLARELEAKEYAKQALASSQAAAEREKRLDQRERKTRAALRQQELEFIEKQKEIQKDLAKQRKLAKKELVRRKEEIDNVLAKKLQELDEQRELNKLYLIQTLRDPAAYLEKSKGELAQREAEFAVQMARQDAQQAAREQQLAEREDVLARQQQDQLLEREELLRRREEAHAQYENLDMYADELARKEDENLVENIFTKWKGLVLDSQVYLKLSTIGIQDDGRATHIEVPSPRGRVQVAIKLKNQGVKAPVAWTVTRSMSSAAKREVERERRQNELQVLRESDERKVLSTMFHIWQGILAKLHRDQHQIRRVEQKREELPKGIAWDVRGMHLKKWEAETEKGHMMVRQDGGKQVSLHTVFFQWKHLLKDPRRISLATNPRYEEPKELNKSVAWSINVYGWPLVEHTAPVANTAEASATLSQVKSAKPHRNSADGPAGGAGDVRPRKGRTGGKPFNYHGAASSKKLDVVRLSLIHPRRGTEDRSGETIGHGNNKAAHESPHDSARSQQSSRRLSSGSRGSRKYSSDVSLSNRGTAKFQAGNVQHRNPGQPADAWVVTF